MNQPESDDDRGETGDHLKNGVVKLGRSTTDNDQDVTDTARQQAEEDRAVSIWLWQHVWRRFTVARIEAVSGLVIVAITASYTYFARRQADAAIKAANAATVAAEAAHDALVQAKLATELDQRAWLYVSNVSLSKDPVGGDDIDFTYG